jgi:hypothetical protein
MKQGKEDSADTLSKVREKKKWQIALRRYVIEKQFSPPYAPYFGIDIKCFRKWIELQFEDGLAWDNFGKSWQLDHIIPVVYFDSANQDDLRLCWNFTNIRVEKLQLNRFTGHRVDVLTARSYFQELYNSTGYALCDEMIKKIEMIEMAQSQGNTTIQSFINEHLDHLSAVRSFNEYEFFKLNSGNSVPDILEERKMLAKFGG